MNYDTAIWLLPLLAGSAVFAVVTAVFWPRMTETEMRTLEERIRLALEHVPPGPRLG